MRTFQEKKAVKVELAIGIEKFVIEGSHWVAGSVPHPNQGGDTRFATTPPRKIYETPIKTSQN